MLTQLSLLFKEPNLYKFSNKSGHNYSMTGIKAVLAEKIDWKKVLQKIQRECKIKDHYKTKLIVLEAKSLDNTSKNKSFA